jgi:ketosteroid isomerase-like protein
LTPEELLNKQVQEFNKGNISYLMTLYENEACFAPRAGEVVRDLDSIRRGLQDIIDMGGKLEAKVKRVLQASDLALMITEWSIRGVEPNGKLIKLSGRGTVVLRQQPDDAWLMVLENPCETG